MKTKEVIHTLFRGDLVVTYKINKYMSKLQFQINNRNYKWYPRKPRVYIVMLFTCAYMYLDSVSQLSYAF